MKKRVRTQPTNPFYSDEPAVAKGLMADKGLVQNASLGNQTPKMVDKKPGRLSGVAGFAPGTEPPGSNPVILPPNRPQGSSEPRIPVTSSRSDLR